MEVKDVSKVVLSPGVSSNTQQPASETKTKESSASGVRIEGSDIVEVSIDSTKISNSETLKTLNSYLSKLNVISEKNEKLNSFVHSISGIIDQASNPETSESHKKSLQNEATGLANEIKRIVTSSPEKASSLDTSDNIKLEIEERLGKTLDVLLHDSSNGELEVGKLDFSHKEAILQNRAQVAKARERIELIQEQIAQVKHEAQKIVTRVESVLHNEDSSKTTVRDIDGAFQLASNTRGTIKEDPASALGSLGDLNRNSIALIEPNCKGWNFKP